MADTKAKITESEGSSGALEVSLHPLVIVNIAHHATRSKVRAGSSRVYGALFGVQDGRHLEIFNSFEVVVTDVDGKPVFDKDYLERKSKSFKQVFKTYDLLGWYTTGKSLNEKDVALHKQLEPFNESPLLLLLDAEPEAGVREIPIAIYESEVKIINDQPVTRFGKISYRLETGDAERLAVDHVARVGGQAEGGSQLTAHLSSMHNAIKMLKMRVGIIRELINQVEAGKLPKNHAILRRVASLVHMLPAIDSSTFKQEFINEYNDALLVAYMASIMKASNSINDLVDKFNAAYDRSTSRRRTFFQ